MTFPEYVPEIGDTVFLKLEGFVKYRVVNVDRQKRTADLKTTSGFVSLLRDIAWEMIIPGDTHQNALTVPA